MYSAEQRRIAIETFIQFDHRYADTIAKLGYPNRATLMNWWKEYKRTGEIPVPRRIRNPKYSDEMKREAVEHYLSHGRRLSRTMGALGYPKSREVLVKWIDELAPGQRRYRGPNPKRDPVSLEKKIQVVAALEARTETAESVAKRHGVSRCSPYFWRREILGDNSREAVEKGCPVSKNYDDLPDDIDEINDMLRAAKLKLRQVQLELDVRQATLEILKKEEGTDPNRLTNAEKAMMVTALRTRWKLNEILPMVGMAKSSYEYARSAREKGERPQRRAVREAVRSAFDESGGTYGYRRVLAALNSNADPSARIGEHTVRAIMAEEGLTARNVKRKRRYSSYAGEISQAPPNLLRDKRGKHRFRSDAPNKLWITDITEFSIPDGKVYLSPVIDCFDGMPISWTISTSPSAEMANLSLIRACQWLQKGDRPMIHSDRGGHYRWPGWIKICEDNKLIRSMSRKGCSPDNSRCEGFFGRLKVEFFYNCDWRGVSTEEFIAMLDAYLRWYCDIRIKSDLGYVSPMQYRRNKGLAA